MTVKGGAGRVTVARALRRAPLRFLVSSWPLRTLGYVLTGTVTGLLAMVWLPVALVAGAVVGTPLLTRPLVAAERRRVVLLGGPALADPHRAPDRAGSAAWLRARYTEAATWRELAYTVLHGSVLLFVNVAALVLGSAPALVYLSGVVNLATSATGDRTTGDGAALAAETAPGAAGGEGVVLLVAGAALAVAATAVLLAYTTAVAAMAHAELARLLLSPADEARVRSLTRSRARLIDAFEVERRRIERDLHDGAQQRLLRLGMTLLTARLEFDHDPRAVRPYVPSRLREYLRGTAPFTGAGVSSRRRPSPPGRSGPAEPPDRRNEQQCRTDRGGDPRRKRTSGRGARPQKSPGPPVPGPPPRRRPSRPPRRR
ncbi:sensor histidine kinase [Streptosporangium carneum]|uniref:Sensor histidine kinase n=1 Tax=Streptosporangium carneum TaxID=47481 RepID=A0A9W6IBR1_9ACTN|nr:sensor domain-containing protein [Streptosporangium carneum]GLK15472.1 hypothetical protein GCM10017600_88850 [Streptosporangium carneum]